MTLSFSFVAKKGSLKCYSLLLFAALFIFQANGQTAGDFRSKPGVNGNWNDPVSWQIYNGSTWINATSAPGDLSVANVLIQDSSTIHVRSTPVYAIGSLAVGQGAGGILNFDSANCNITISGTTTIYSNAQVNFTMAGVRVFADVIIKNGGLWNNTSFDVTINGNLNNAGTFNAGTGNYTFTSSSGMLTGTLEFNKLTISGSYMNQGRLVTDNSLSGSGTLVQGANSSLTIAKTITITTLDASSNKPNIVIYNNRIAQTAKQMTYDDLLIADSAKVSLPAGITTVLDSFSVKQGATLTIGSGTLALNNAFVNNGTLTANGSGSIIMQGSQPQFMNGKFTANQVTNLTVNNAAGVYISGVKLQINNSINLLAGDLAADSAITFGCGGTNSFTYVRADGFIGTPLIINYGAGVNSFTYSGTSAQSTGIELPDSFSFLIINNAAGVTLTKSVNVTTLKLTSGILHSLPYLITVTGTASNSLIGGAPGSYVKGSLARAFPASVTPGAIYSFPVGNSNYQLFELVSPVVSGAGVVTVTEFDANSGGSAGFAIANLNTNHYWSAIPSPANLIANTSIRLTDGNMGTANTLGQSPISASGTYYNIGGSVSGQTISSFSADPALGYFVFATGGPIAAGTYPLGTNRPLMKIANLAAILNSAALAGNVIFELQPGYDGTTEILPITFDTIIYVGGPWMLTLRPAPGAPMMITAGDPLANNSLISFSGTGNIILDGRAGGVGTSIGWIFRNKNNTVAGPTFNFTNGAAKNTITYIQAEGQNTSNVSGTIVFGTSTRGSNDSNVISFCNLRNRSDTTGVPSPCNAIYSHGSPGAENHHTAILNNSIENFTGNGILAATTSSTGGAGYWNIQKNSFYCTGGDSTGKTIINLSNGNYPGNGGNQLIGNYIGGNAPSCRGTWQNNANAPFNAINLVTDATVPTSVQGNIIQHIALNDTGSAFTGIGITAGTADIGTVTGNIIDSILVAGSGGFKGIYSNPSSATSLNIAGNTVTAVNVTGTSLACTNTGIVALAGVNNITGNTICNLNSASGNTGAGKNASVIGISVVTTKTANQVISQNSVYALSNTNPTADVKLVGINFSGSTTGINTISKNFIHNISTVSSSVLSQQTGINAAGGVGTYSNNMVSLGFDPSGTGQTVTPVIAGIDKSSTSNTVFFYNSVFIGGSFAGSGLANTYAFRRTTAATTKDSVRDNIFMNARSNTSTGGKHYAMSLDTALKINSDYNVLYVTGNGGTLSCQGNSNYITLASWQSLGLDSNSLSHDPSFVMPGGNALTTNLHIKTTSPACVESAGIPVDIYDDIDGDTRNAVHPDIGADEGNFICLSPDAAGAITGPASLCSGDTKTYSIIPVTGATYYIWSVPAGAVINSGQNSASIAVTFAGSSGIITVTPHNACDSSGSASLSITVNPLPVVSATVSPSASICSGSSVTLNGTGAVSYIWNGGVTNGVAFAPSATRSYIVTGTDQHACTNSDTILITVNPSPVVGAKASPSVSVCAGIAVTLTGTGALSYIWTGGVVNGSSFTPAATNTYTVTGTDVNGCTNTKTIIVTVKPLPSVSTLVLPSDTICAGSGVTLTATGDSSSTYSWSGGITNGVAFVPAATKTYTITATSSNGCTNTAGITVHVNSLPVVRCNVSPSSVVCNGASVTLYGTGATTYVWTGNVINNVAFVPLSTATYTVTGTDNNGCTNTKTITVTVNPNPSVGATVSPSSSVCPGTAVTLNAVGDTGNIYSWTNGVVNGSQFIPAGTKTYTVTATNIYNCKSAATATVTVNSLPAVGVTATPASRVCSGTAVTLNGTGAVSYAWTGGVTNGVAFTPDHTNSYSVTGTDSNGCSKVNVITIIVDLLPTVGINVTPSSVVCHGTSVKLSGTGARSYVWTGNITNGVSFLPDSTQSYTVVGTDINGCTNTQSVIVTVYPLPVVKATVSPSSPVCAGTSVTLTETGDSSNTYTWSSGVVDGVAFIPAATNTYTVTATSVNSCTSTSTITITVNALPLVNYKVSPNDTVCSGTSVTLTGTGALSYIWTGGVVNGNSFIPAATNTYTVTGTDVNGCTNTRSLTMTINPLPAVVAAASPADSVCYNTTVVLNGQGDLTNIYTWSGGIFNNVPFNATGTKTYTVTATGTNSCKSTATITIYVNPLLVVSATVTPSKSICLGSSLTLTGTGAASYAWVNTAGHNVTDGQSFNPDTTATYTVTGTDKNGCTATHSVTVTVKPLPVVGIIASPSSPVCYNSYVTLNGTGASTYIWTNGVKNGIHFFATATTMYVVTGTDINGCTNTDTISITVNPPPAVGISTNPPRYKLCAGDTTMLRGTGAVAYLWSDSLADGMSFVPAATNTYTVTGTDNMGCTATNTVKLTVNPLPHVGIKATPGTTLCAGSSVTLRGTGASSYSWTSTWTGFVYDGIPFNPDTTRSYIVTGTDNNTCQNKDTVTIIVNPLPVVKANATSTNVCSGSLVTLYGTGDPSNTYIWTGGINDSVPYTMTVTKTYTVTGTNNYSCANTATINIIVYANPVINANASPATMICLGQPVTLRGTGALTYTWVDTIGANVTDGQAFFPDITTTYTVTGTDYYGCSGTHTMTITIKPLPDVSAIVVPNKTVCSAQSITLTATGASTYSWSNGMRNGNTFKIYATSLYSVIGTAFNGCTNTCSITVTVSVPPVNAVVYPSMSFCAGTPVTLTGTGADSYAWTGGAINGVPFVPDTNKYTVTGTDSIGCKDSLHVVLNINPLPPVGIIANPPSGILCNGSAITLNGTGALSYSWTGGVTDGVAFTPDSNASYIVTGVNDSSCINTDTIMINVNPIPPIPVITVSNDTLKSSATTGKYEWLCNDTIITGANSRTYRAVKDGIYKVMITVNGCSSYSDTVSINTIGINEFYRQTLLVIYPNPASSKIIIKGNIKSDFVVNICNALGEISLNKRFPSISSEVPLDVSSLAAGLYFVKLDSENSHWLGWFVKE